MKTLNHSEYQLTIIDSGLLAQRLATQIRTLILDLKGSWPAFKQDPWSASANFFHALFYKVGQQLRSPTQILSYVTACFVIVLVVAVVSLIDRSRNLPNTNSAEEMLIDPQNV